MEIHPVYLLSNRWCSSDAVPKPETLHLMFDDKIGFETENQKDFAILLSEFAFVEWVAFGGMLKKDTILANFHFSEKGDLHPMGLLMSLASHRHLMSSGVKIKRMSASLGMHYDEFFKQLVSLYGKEWKKQLIASFTPQEIPEDKFQEMCAKMRVVSQKE